jgi:TetR/AcrR family transcriptional regulator, transcriptional repressor for nem operon
MTRQQSADARRQAILDAAASLLADNGLSGTSIEAVARSAGIAKGTVYLYFASRSDLLAALRTRYAQGLAGRAETILSRAKPDDAGSVVRAFQRLAAELLDYVLSSRRLYHVLFQEAGVSEEETMAPLRHLVLGALRQAMEQGALQPMDPDVLMRFLLDGLHGAMLPLFHQSTQDRRHAQAGLNEVIRRALAPAVPVADRDELHSRAAAGW